MLSDTAAELRKLADRLDKVETLTARLSEESAESERISLYAAVTRPFAKNRAQRGRQGASC